MVGYGVLRDRALAELDGLGAPGLGQWEEQAGRFLHIRRRLSFWEAQQVGPVRDIRRTSEARIRAARLPAELWPLVPEPLFRAEVG